jgi:hypothetical protein
MANHRAAVIPDPSFIAMFPARWVLLVPTVRTSMALDREAHPVRDQAVFRDMIDHYCDGPNPETERRI